ncbi:MAG: ATP-dependent zinc metalloprotease FtsH [Thermodesulfobacteriota bacterium]
MKSLLPWLAFFLVVYMLVQLLGGEGKKPTEVSYSNFVTMVKQGQVQDVEIQGQKIIGRDKNKGTFTTYAPEDKDMVGILRSAEVTINAKPSSDPAWHIALYNGLPLLILIGIWIWFIRNMQSSGGKVLSFGKSKARLMTEQAGRVTFEDVAGIDEVKEELFEIVDFLKDPKKFTRLGGRIPKGLLLMGPPGSGKTLLARAIAGEAGVPFFSISGSDFVEVFVGVGASRVRDLFLQGKKHAPCIIFIDEIDAVGRHRGAGLGGGHDEREQTLNQLLVEMDGFESNEGVILISATNRPDVLDPALLRPGRFDRQVVVPLPDILGRERILRVHMRKTPLSDDVDVSVLARGTPGFSGADLENLVNEAALLAAKRNREKLTMEDFEDAKDKVFMGLARKSRALTEDDRMVVAYHEGGHALVGRFLPESDPVNKVTIIPRGRALGVTWYLPDERELIFRERLETQLAISMGGRAAEEMVLKRVSTGAQGDIKSATVLAQRMVRDWGMSEKLGPLSYSHGEEENIFLGREISRSRDYSEKTAQDIDQEVHVLIMNAYKVAKNVLRDNLDILHKLAELLLEKETISGKEMDELILSMRPGLVLPSQKRPEPARVAGTPSPLPDVPEPPEGEIS